ncbi:polysaccharide deacetylase family protein [Dyadobacter sp. Leaf189]|uniref:polysaccharide deacetylase family protein n=1 Tax=Dyadobacter sp. Leaf189 TaxID=1736295 RepID=UPI0006FA6681|nr:polysaccharide deacetylase family protein [Dyadobacter sp. Leaf189]KQS33353.1 polysaccharide deacetylase [Dyadobacter sp. Leaf189]
MFNNIITILALLLFGNAAQAQKSVAITIDDVPNVQIVERDGGSRLLKRLDSLHIPVAIFINEANLLKTGHAKQNQQLLKSWLVSDFITPGNHTYSHPNYGEAGFNAFSEDVIKGEKLTRKILAGTGKKLSYFRFPFNAMGKDSLAHLQMQQFLVQKGYRLTPFTVESEDWLYNELYEKALRKGNSALADSIADQYITMSLKLFSYIDSISVAMFGKEVRHIYLCHDNRLNTDYLPVLIQKLKDNRYQLVSLDEAMEDPAYRSIDYYHGNAGFSWLYRWMKHADKRKAAMRAEPLNPGIQRAYDEMKKSE